MRARRWVLALWMAGVIAGAWSTGRISVASAATLTVCASGCQYTDIPSAVNAAGNGDTISIGPGTYTGGIGINKSLALTGSSSAATIISGGVSISSSNATPITVTINAVTITGATDGISMGAQCSLTLMNSTISGNKRGIDSNKNMTIINTTISGNDASSGGGIGGGLYLYGGSQTSLINSTVSGNAAASGGGIYVDSGGTSVYLSNTIVAGNTATTAGPDCYVAFDEALTDGPGGHNILGKSDGCSGLTNGTNGDQVGTSANPVNPKLGPLANNGGPTQTMALQLGSPAISAGDTTTCKGLVGPNGTTTDTDQRGQPRKSAIRSYCDVGAYDTAHLSTTYYVDAGAANGDSVPCSANSSTNPFQTITYALTCANNGDTIRLAGGSYAGGLTLNKSLTLIGSTSASAVVSGGGPVITVPSGVTVTLTNLTITGGNNSAGTGGGIANSGTLAVLNSTLSANTAASSGGIYNAGTATIVDSTITGNTGTNTYGGGIGNFGSLSVTNSTISNNTAAQGGGINNRGSSAVLVNTLLAGNKYTAAGGPDCYGTITETAAGHNLVGNNTTCNTAALTNGDQVGTNGAPIDPKLAPLANNGGPTQTMALMQGSPAISAGDATTCTALLGPDGTTTDTDQRGQPRKSATRGDCDIGAYDTGHVPTTFYINLTGSDTVTCAANTSANPFRTIAYALSACVNSGDTISLAGGSPALNYVGGFTLSRSVKLVGPGAGAAAIIGPNGATAITISAGSSVSISGVTITHNVQSTGNTGAGIVNFGDLTLRSSTVTQNAGSCGYGGLYNDNSSTMIIQNSTISQNKIIAGPCFGDGAGGIFSRGALTITGSTFSGNTGGSYGGAIYTEGTLHLTNSTFSGNTAAYGGGLQITGSATITNSTISGNTVTGNGGGIDNSGPTAISLANTILAGNTATLQGPDCAGSLADGAGHNLLGKSDGCTYTPGPSDQVGTVASPLDPMLGALANNGGPTQTMSLQSTSPAKGAGDFATCFNAPVNDLDQRGYQRGSSFRAACDIGAYDTYGDTHVVSIQASPGWAMIGGSPLTLLPDATISWSWSATSGQWTQPTGTEPGGTGAWEELTSGGSEAVNIQDCTNAPSIPVQPHRWNLVGNPCKQTVQLPAGTRALLWSGSTYTISPTIPPGMAAWVLPNISPLSLTPVP